MIDNKWYESIQHFQSPYPLTAVFCRELSILGPLLFSIYTNDLPSAPKKCSVHSYVDDTKLFVSFKMKDSVNTFADLRDDLHRKGQWCSNNLLLLNPSKTKLMVFGSRQTHSKLVTPSPTFMVGRERTGTHL